MNLSIVAGLLIPFLGTTAGAACVFFLKKQIGGNIQRIFTGFAAGVMVAASVWSLLIPAMDMCEEMGKLSDHVFQGHGGIDDFRNNGIAFQGPFEREICVRHAFFVSNRLYLQGVAHIGIGTATGDDKAIEAVKQAVTSPLLETTIEGATHVIINISGDISLIEANEAASYVQELAGENANIIFGAMFDENAADTATITVIATGLEDSNVNNAMAGFTAKVQTPRRAVKPSYTYSGSASAAASRGVNAGHASTQQTASTISQSPLPGLKQPGQVTSNVKEKGINIPTFLQKTKK